MKHTDDIVTGTTTLRADVIEHVMRLTSDDLLALPFLDATPGSFEFFNATGRLLTETTRQITPGSPLHRWSRPFPTPSTPDWRTHVTSAPMSLWGELATLRALHGPTPAPDPLTELLTLRERT